MSSTADTITVRRLAWQCRRGMLELDDLLQTFLDDRYAQLSPSERNAFERLLQLPDQELSELLLRGERCTDQDVNDVIDRIRRAPHR